MGQLHQEADPLDGIDLDALPSVVRRSYLENPTAGRQMEEAHNEVVRRENEAFSRMSTEEQQVVEEQLQDFLASIATRRAAAS